MAEIPPPGPPLSLFIPTLSSSAPSISRVAGFLHRHGHGSNGGLHLFYFSRGKWTRSATAWKSVGTSACREEKGGDGGVCMILSRVETVGFHLKVDEMGVNVGCYFVPSRSSPFCLPGALAYNNINSVRIHPGLELFYRP